MGRLIDADELIEQGWRLERHGQSNELVGVMSIADVPTAFNVEAVEKELEEKYSQDVGYLKMISVDKAIEIVRRGGVK